MVTEMAEEGTVGTAEEEVAAPEGEEVAAAAWKGMMAKDCPGRIRSIHRCRLRGLV